LGCGIGSNALYLAQQGFIVHAVDLSDIAIENLREKASRTGLKTVITEITSLENYKIKDNYDIILASKSLHFLYRDKALELIEQMQEHTNVKGMNLIVNKRNLPPEYTQDKAYRFFTGERELANLYESKGWRSINYEEVDFSTLNLIKDPPQTIEQKHALLLAQKI
jgi:tellurite methyltransferase